MMFNESIQAGRLEIFSDEPGWNLAQGTGDRSFRKLIVFEKQFMHSPLVVTSLSGLDAAKEWNLRLVVEPQAVTPFGFDLEMRTWADTSISYLAVTWMAFEIVG